jgi:hypothetical protein
MDQKIRTWYSNNFESRLRGRYITLDHIKPILQSYHKIVKISVAGYSELGKDINIITIGKGRKKILAWSQMHGNESTTTKAVFDILAFFSKNNLFKSEIRTFLENYTLCVIPMLNPDGAKLYTRENANGVDLNRDAQDLSQLESRMLHELFHQLKPDLCLNLHDQRSLFGLQTNLPAWISFLSPAADSARSSTPERRIAMKHIVGMNKILQELIPGKVGRYDDTYNPDCVGDKIQKSGTPTILIEAGHARNDYHREQSRELVFYALLTLFGIIEVRDRNLEDYFMIPENTMNYRDVIIRNVKLETETSVCSIAIQYEEQLVKDKIEFVPKLKEIGNLDHLTGHREIQVNGAEVLLNSQNNLDIGEIVSIISNKIEKSLIYFDKSSLMIN